MGRFKESKNLLSLNCDDDTFTAPPFVPWTSGRLMRFEDVDVWEVICEQSGPIGVYAAAMPYGEMYVVMKNWSIAEEFSGPLANSMLEAYLIKNKIPYPRINQAAAE